MHLNSEYPITKKQLQTGFILKNKITDMIKNEFFDKCVIEELNKISIEIVKKTINEQLYNQLTTTEYDDVQKKRIIDRVKEMQSYKYNFTSNILDRLNNGYINQMRELCSNSIYVNDPNLLDEFKLKIFNGLKERFPDCLIQIDPLKTYILIDWN